jgi:hypothetical protein
MKRILLSSLVCVYLISCQNTPTTENKTENPTDSLAATSEKYTRYVGVLGSDSIVLHLVDEEDTYAGWYSLQRVGQPIPLYFEPKSDSTFMLMEYTKADNNQYFDVKILPNQTLVGSWVGEKTHAIELHPQYHQAVTFKLEEYTQSAPFPNKDADQEANAHATLLIPKSGGSEDVLSGLLKAQMDSVQDPQTFVKQNVQKYLDHYLIEARTAKDNGYGGPSWAWEYMRNVNIAWNS